jgi:hypothetical protein
LRIRLAEAAEPARGFHALLKRCEAAVRAAATHRTTAVVRAPRIVLGFAWSVQRSCCNDNTYRKQEQFHPQLPFGLLTISTINFVAQWLL